MTRPACRQQLSPARSVFIYIFRSLVDQRHTIETRIFMYILERARNKYIRLRDLFWIKDIIITSRAMHISIPILFTIPSLYLFISIIGILFNEMLYSFIYIYIFFYLYLIPLQKKKNHNSIESQCIYNCKFRRHIHQQFTVSII